MVPKLWVEAFELEGQGYIGGGGGELAMGMEMEMKYVRPISIFLEES